MKKSLLFAAALCMAASVSAADYFMVGANINGSQNWDPGTVQMTATSTAGVYEWTGTQLGSQFKITEGASWDNAIGQGSGNLTLGQPYSYNQGGSTENITIEGVSVVNNPKVVLDTNAKTVTVTGDSEAFDPSKSDYFLIGSNVNGFGWTDGLGNPALKFTYKDNGIFEWKGEVLGTSFKINDGTWGPVDLGGSGAKLVLGTEYTLVSGGANLDFEGVAEVLNPVVVLNINGEAPTLLVTGESGGDITWHICGLNGGIPEGALPKDFPELAPTDEEGIFLLSSYAITETAGEFKISSTGWGEQYGAPEGTSDEVFISPDQMEVQLGEVGSTGMVSYELEEGFYDITWDYNELYITFAKSTDDSVEAIVVGNDSNAVYYNLHGVQVNNPDKGIFIRVANGKASKVVK